MHHIDYTKLLPFLMKVYFEGIHQNFLKIIVELLGMVYYQSEWE